MGKTFDVTALDQLADEVLSGNKRTDSAYLKIQAAANNARKRGVQIDDYDIDDFYNATKPESGRSHFESDGKTVKFGVPTQDGQRAVGFSQILPSTAKSVDANLDPTDELSNIELGLRYFKNLSNDPIERRLRYVGGGDKVINYYRQNGVAPDWKLYSYLPNNKETYKSYVEKGLGGKIRTDLNALDSLTQPNFSALDALANESMAQPNTQNTPVSDEQISNSTITAPNLEQSQGGNVTAQQNTVTLGIDDNLTQLRKQFEEDLRLEKAKGKKADKNRIRQIEQSLKTMAKPAELTLPGVPNGLSQNNTKTDFSALDELAQETFQNAPQNLPTQDGNNSTAQPLSVRERVVKLRLGDEQNPYAQSDNQENVPAGKVRVTDKDGKTYLAAQSKDNQYSIERELPAWAIGKTKPKTVLPNDAQLRKSYQTYRKSYGLIDSEELRQKAITAYNTKTPIFSDDEKTTLDELRDGVGNSDAVASQQQQATKRRKSTRQFVSTPVQQTGQYDFERTGRIKTNDGELKLVRGGDGLQQGEYRFEDEKGETFIVNPAAKEIKDESLAQPVEAITVKLSERGTNINMARSSPPMLLM